MKNSKTKKETIAALAERASLSVEQAANFLEALADLTYEEAHAERGFTIPGICKVSVVMRKPRKVRNPRNGRILLIGARRAVKVKALKKAKDSIAPRPQGNVREMETHDTEIAHTEQAPQTPQEAGFIAMRCPHCGQEIEAEETAAGMEIECPGCGGALRAPTIHNEPHQASGQFVYFLCTGCNQEIEAAKSLTGADILCPSCGISLVVPSVDDTADAPAPEQPLTEEEKQLREKLRKAAMGRTMRIELPEDIEIP